MGIELVKKDYFKASHDSVFSMLRDMAEQRFEQNVLLPLVIEFESECEDVDKYKFYFEELSPVISYCHINSDDKIHLVLYHDFNGEAVEFLYTMARYHVARSKDRTKRINAAEDKLMEFLIKERAYKIEDKLETSNYLNDDEVYALIKETWIGDMLYAMANLKETLEHRRKAEELDLSCLLTE